ncbi:MAG: hypothetical protein RL186_786 [Pseudomonadota bacterium]
MAHPASAQVTPYIFPGPSARVEPVTETFFGEAVTDPYRWMENAKDPEWAPFMQANAKHARGILDQIAGRAAMNTRISALTGAFDVVSSVKRKGERLFFQKRVAGQQSFAVFVREADRERVLIDPNILKQNGAHVSLDWWEPSPNGSHVVYGLSAAGSEDSVLHVLDVATNTILPERIGQTQYASPVWLPDGTGFFYNRLQGAAAGSVDYYLDSGCWLHKVGEDPARDRLMLKRGQYGAVAAEPTDFPFIACNASSDYVLAIFIGGVRRENPVWTAKRDALLAGKPVWKQACTVSDQVIAAELKGDQLFMLTTKGAENGKVVATSAARPSFAKAKTLVAQSDLVIEAIAPARDGLYLQTMDGGYSGIQRLPHRDGAAVETFKLPFEGTAAIADSNPSVDGILLTLTSWLEPNNIYALDPISGAITNTGLAPRPPIDTSPYEALRTFATAKDGTQIPLSIIRRKDAPKDGQSPTLVSAYGSYQISTQPFFWTRGFAFLEAGGMLAIAHVRGGGEYGRRWWKAGQKKNKPNTWRDLIACCEHLIAQRYTSPAHLAINGGSAGGITVGMALVERPDLFCAVIPDVGLLNALRAETGQNGPPNIDEFGTVKESDGFQGLKAMDALSQVKDGQRYPAVLLNHGMTDPRVDPWHSAKFVARLRAADPKGGPFLLRVTFDAGHGLGSTRSQLDSQYADIFSFVLWRAGKRGLVARVPNSG